MQILAIKATQPPNDVDMPLDPRACVSTPSTESVETRPAINRINVSDAAAAGPGRNERTDIPTRGSTTTATLTMKNTPATIPTSCQPLFYELLLPAPTESHEKKLMTKPTTPATKATCLPITRLPNIFFASSSWGFAGRELVLLTVVLLISGDEVRTPTWHAHNDRSIAFPRAHPCRS